MKYTMTQESITIVTKDGPVTVREGHPNYALLRKAVVAEDEEKALSLLTVKAAIEEWTSGKFSVQDKTIYHGDDALPQELSQRIINMVTRDEDPKGFLRFWERLNNNPSYRSVQQLFRFLSNQNIPIDDQGMILTYKGVRADLKDCHTGTVSNDVGRVNEMPRNKISDDPKQACHYGFHVGALEYARSFGGAGSRVVICRVDPADVVCVPYDHSSQKMRVCKYEIVGFYSGQALPSTSMPLKTKEPAAPKKAKRKKGQAKVRGKQAKRARVKDNSDWGPLTPAGIKKLDAMALEELAELHIVTLRRYASHLKVVGAYKLPGGKLALLDAISLARGK